MDRLIEPLMDKLIEPFMNFNFEDNINGKREDSIKEKYLEWLVRNSEVKNQDKLYQILNMKHWENHEIIAKIKFEFGEVNSKLFMRDLATSICRSCLDTNFDFNVDLFKTRCSILTVFISKMRELELETLMAIQALDHEINQTHKKPGLIRLIFDILSDENVISEGMFWKWKRKDSDQEGHIKSIRRLKDFFTQETQSVRNARRQEKLKNDLKHEVIKKARIQRKKSKINSKLIEANEQASQFNLADYTEAFSMITSTNELTDKSKESLEDKLTNIFKNYDSNNSILYEKIKFEFGKMETLSKKSIRILVNALCRSCVDSNGQIQIASFKNRCLILAKFINKNKTIELEALNAIKAFIQQNKYLQGMDKILSAVLFKHEIVSDDVHNKWNDEKTKSVESLQTTSKSDELVMHTNSTVELDMFRNNTPDLDQNIPEKIKNFEKNLEFLAKMAEKETQMTKKDKRKSLITFSEQSSVRSSKFTSSKPIEPVFTNDLENKLLQIVKDQNTKNEKIFNKIELELDETERLCKEFPRVLISSICKSCLNNGSDFNAVLFKKRCPLLNIYISQNEEAELTALRSIQAFCSTIQNRPGLILTCLFDTLYMEQIISENSFLKWKLLADEKSIELSKEFFFKITSKFKKNEKQEERKSCMKNASASQIGEHHSPSPVYHSMYQSSQIPIHYNYILPVPTPIIATPIHYSPFHPISPHQMHQPHIYYSPHMSYMLNAPHHPGFSSNSNLHSFQFQTKSVIKNPQQSTIDTLNVPVVDNFKNQRKKDSLSKFSASVSSLETKKTAPKSNPRSQFEPKTTKKKTLVKTSSIKVSPALSSEETVCPICIDSISNLKKSKIRLMSTHCGHVICKGCIESLFRKGDVELKSSECPICRSVLNKTLIHDIFL